MASKKRKLSDTDRNPNPLSNREQSSQAVNGNELDTARSADGLKSLGTDDIILQQALGVEDSFSQVCGKNEIQPKMSKYLHKLRNFEIAVVCDDSSSMARPIAGKQRTRWDELCSIVKIIIEICVIFDSNGVDVYFLNRPSRLNVIDPSIIDQEFRTPPDGYTPLVPVLDRIFRSECARQGRGKKLLVFVATDGEPTDKYGRPNLPELERIMNEVRCAETTYVSFLICTDDTEGVDYLDEWDKKMVNVDINDDYYTQRDKIRQRRNQRNYPFTHGDYIVKALVGAVVPELDLLDEWD